MFCLSIFIQSYFLGSHCQVKSLFWEKRPKVLILVDDDETNFDELYVYLLPVAKQWLSVAKVRIFNTTLTFVKPQ